MRKFKSILFLFILGIILFPWQMICTAHIFGHSHHKQDVPSLCELRRQYKGEGAVFWPPMDCRKNFSTVSDFQEPQNEKIVPTIQMLAIVAILFDVVTLDNQEQLFLLPPAPNCRSATLLSDSPLRAPPLV